MKQSEFIAQFDGTLGSDSCFASVPPVIKCGTEYQNAAHVGVLNELTFCTETKTFHLHDGETPGGALHWKLQP